MNPERRGGPRQGAAPAADDALSVDDRTTPPPLPIDDSEAVHKVVVDPIERARWRAADRAVRRALRDLPPSPAVDAARSLAAVARVADRRERALEALARAVAP